MKRIGIITKILPLKEVEFTMKDNSKNTLAKFGVLVTTGGQSIYVEFIQDLARSLSKTAAVNQTVLIEYDCTAREFQGKDGETRFDNQLRGRALQIFSDRVF